MTLLCVPIIGPTIAEAKLQIERAGVHADLFEIRTDLFSFWDPVAMQQLISKPFILTLKKNLWVDCKALKPAFIDIAWDDDINKAKSLWPSSEIIVSYHDFERTGDIAAILEKMPKCADLYKIATMAESTLDALRMLLFVRNHPQVIGLCMGEKGAVSRILAPCFGAKIAYAAASDAYSSAPGQMTVDELIKRYRFKSLGPQTKLLGLIGNPVSKSPSFITHNQVIQDLELDAVYVKMQISKEEIFAFMDLAKEISFTGLSVTMPLKESLFSQAANTLVFKNGSVTGINTDRKGALDAIEQVMTVANKTILIIGYGGAAKAIAEEAKMRGAHTIIVNRSKVEGALTLAEAFINVPDYDILINCTPVEDESLFGLLKKDRLVMDIVVSKEDTRLLRQAKRMHCKTIHGYEMLKNQAALQFHAWFDENLNMDKAFEKVFRNLC